MPLFIMTPSNLDEMLSKNQASVEIIDGLHQALLHIKTAIETQNSSQQMGQLLQHLGFKKKKFEKKWVYTVNASVNEGAHRFIFEKLTGDEGVFFVLRDVALHHHYGKALRWTSLHSSTNNLTEAWLHSEGYITLACSDNWYDESELEQAQVMINYGREYISLSDIQTSVLSQSLFPQLLIGPPGSGKTLLIHAFFQEQVLQHLESKLLKSTPLKLLYLTKNTALVESLKGSWDSWQKKIFGEDDVNFEVSFQTMDAFHQEYIEKYLSESKENIVSRAEYLEKIKKVLKQKKWKKLKLSPQRVLEEICHSAYILYDDINTGFAESNYKNLGVNQITIDKEWQEDIFKLFKTINLQMISSLAISTFQDDDKYDLVCVDESQQLSLQQLTNALTVAKNEQVLYCGDSNQRGEVRVPSMPLFIHHMRNQGCELYHTTLPSSHRLKPRTARLVSELVKLEGTLRGGLVDNTAYASLSSAHIEDSDDSVCWVDEYTSSYANLKNKASFAVLVLTQNDIDNAKQLTGCETVILADEVHGLEYDEIFVYVSQKTQNSFKLASQKMIEKGISPLTQLAEMTNQSPTKNADSKHEYAIFSKLFIALSRSLNRVHLYFEGSKKVLKLSSTSAPNRQFLSWLKYQCHEQIELAIENSTPLEWLTFINKLIQTSDMAMINIAHTHLKAQFSLTQEMARNYIEAYPLTLATISIEQCLLWIDTQKTMSQPKTQQAGFGGESECKRQLTKKVKKPIADSDNLVNSQETIQSVEPKQPAKSNMEQYLIKLWQEFTYQNITLLLKSKKMAKLLFSLSMPKMNDSNVIEPISSPHSLFDNLLLSRKKFVIFLQALIRIKKSSRKSDVDNFIIALRKELKNKYQANGKLVTKLEIISKESRERCFLLIFKFWDELTLNHAIAHKEEVLASEDLLIENRHVVFVHHAIHSNDFLDVLLTDPAFDLLNGYDVAHALFHFFDYSKENHTKTYVFMKLFNHPTGIEVIKEWLHRLNGYSNTFSVAKELLRFDDLSVEQYAVKDTVLAICVTNLFLKLFDNNKEPGEIVIILDRVSCLLNSTFVQNIIFEENYSYYLYLFSLEMSKDVEISQRAFKIINQGNVKPTFINEVLNDIIPDLLTRLTESNSEEDKLKTLSDISRIVTHFENEDVVDRYHLLKKILPLLHQKGKYAKKVLFIINILVKTKDNFDLFIDLNIPELMLVLMKDKSIKADFFIAKTLLTLLAFNLSKVCRSIDKQFLLEASDVLTGPKTEFDSSILILLQYFPLRNFENPIEQQRLQKNVFEHLKNIQKAENVNLSFKALNSMIYANFQPIVLDSELLLELSNLTYSHVNDYENIIMKVINFLKTAPENTQTLSRINAFRQGQSPIYSSIHTPTLTMFGIPPVDTNSHIIRCNFTRLPKNKKSNIEVLNKLKPTTLSH